MKTRTHSRHRSGLLFTVVALFAGLIGSMGSIGSAAEHETRAREPQVVTSGMAEVEIPATTAAFAVSITARAASALQASSESAATALEVTRSLHSAGLSSAEITESRLSVGPIWSYDEKSGRQRRIGYEATTTIRIETDHLDRLGADLDAALTAGATQTSEIEFSARNIDEARRRALGEAVARATGDAEAIARAGSGRLGSLLLLTTEPAEQPRAGAFESLSAAAARRAAPSAPPQIIPSRIQVTARVVGHWAFVAGTAQP